jgi:hypothetical protein|tara:strand:- start:262 stop:606 length:345 start_codon:yes stop_codon:yes gene_type:complete
MYRTKLEANDTKCHAKNEACKATDCMGWRWGEKLPRQKVLYCENAGALTPEDGAAAEATFIPPGYTFERAKLAEQTNADGSLMVEKAARWVEPETGTATRRRGYCGSAGIPEHE